MAFQVADSARKKPLSRTEHAWTKRRGGQWVCVLCGAVVKVGLPPNMPTPDGWMPDHYIPLTDEDRAKVPFDSATAYKLR